MKRRINPLWVCYLLFIFLPIAVVLTILTALTTMIMSPLFGDSKWGFYPGKWWSRAICFLSFIRVRVIGREHYQVNKSYIFVANHQSIFDIWLIYGWINTPFKWIMKKEIRKIPLVGKACDAAGHIFADRSNSIRAKRSIEEAEERLRKGASVVIFPEGTRTKTGGLARFKKGAFMIAADLHLPVVPITIKGAYEALPYNSAYIKPGVIEMIVHEPIDTTHLTYENLPEFMQRVHDIIEQDL